jgi:protease IV
MYSSLSDFSPDQWAKFNAWLDRVYNDFTDKVAKGRRLPKERVLEIAKGRIWSGQDALRLGLVDELGGFTRAVESAREFAKISAGESVKLVRFPRPKSLLEVLRRKAPDSSEATMVRAAIKAIEPLRPVLRALKKMNESPDAEVLAMPEIDVTN